MADLVMNRRAAKRPRERSAGSSERTSRILLLVIAVLALALIVELLFHFALAPRLTISEIAVESEIGISDAELLELAGLERAPAYFSVDAENVAANIETHPAVQAATVEKVFPNRLEVSIAGRKPLLLTLASTRGHMRPVAVDAEGIVFEPDAEVASWDLPVVSGIRFEGFTPGVQLPGMLHEFLEDVRRLKLDYPVLYDQISEYRIVRTGDHSFDVVIYPVNYDTPVRVGSQVDGSLCKYIIMVLDAFERDGRLEGVAELDFRGDEIVFRTKEGNRATE